MSHHCSTTFVRCIDFRLNRALTDYLAGQGLAEDADLIAVAGGVKDRDYVLGQIALSKKLHETSRAILVNHTDCGGYGGRKAFASAAEELERHTADLHAVKAELQSRFPGFTVQTLIADIRPDGKIDIKEV